MARSSTCTGRALIIALLSSGPSKSLMKLLREKRKGRLHKSRKGWKRLIQRNSRLIIPYSTRSFKKRGVLRERVKKGEGEGERTGPKETIEKKKEQAAEDRKITQLSQVAQARVSKKQAPKRKRVERCTSSASGVVGEESLPTPPPKVTRRRRNITVPRKFR
jgi:hypothetical protein